MKTSPLELDRLLSPAQSSLKTGRFAGTDAEGRPLVQVATIAGGGSASTSMSTSTSLSKAAPALVLSIGANAPVTARMGDPVLLAFPDGADGPPVLLGFLSAGAALAGPTADPVAGANAATNSATATTADAGADARVDAEPETAVRLGRGRKEARLDGRCVTLEAQDEIVLKCGRSSLTLRRNGEVILRGVRVLSRAAQTQRIRGASVQIN